MKKLMALILLGATLIVPSAYGFFGRGSCCDTCNTCSTCVVEECGCGYADCCC